MSELIESQIKEAIGTRVATRFEAILFLLREAAKETEEIAEYSQYHDYKETVPYALSIADRIRYLTDALRCVY